MHSDDMERMVNAAVAARLIRPLEGEAMVAHYKAARAEIEAEHERKYAAIRSDKPFDKFMLARDPWIGFPFVILLPLLAWAIVMVVA